MIGLAALAILGGLSFLGNMITTAANEAHSKAAREDEQAFNAEQAEIQRQFESGQAETARQFSAAEAEKQRSWEKMMSDTSYQRQRADLEAAGYNPASIGLTNGASTPQGATGIATSARGVGASSPSIGGGQASFTDYFSQLMSSAISYKMSQDKNFTNKAIAEMYNSNARQMNEMTNATKKALAQMGKNTKVYGKNGDLLSETVSEATGASHGFAGFDQL